ncbi:hypothetical protein [Paeniglutamicibacter sp.]|uniref:hypothetical protein n=1 Tax=Paeniglutamicibacter sp. TaxID=1934391 RepID=UPI003989CADA
MVPESTGAFFTDLGSVVALGLELAGTSSLGDAIAEPDVEVGAELRVEPVAFDPVALDAGGSDDGFFVVALVAVLSLLGALTFAPEEVAGVVAVSVALGLGSLPATLAAGVRAATLKAIDAPTKTTMTASAQASHFLFCICPH